jgi:hypothetical protein
VGDLRLRTPASTVSPRNDYLPANGLKRLGLDHDALEGRAGGACRALNIPSRRRWPRLRSDKESPVRDQTHHRVNYGFIENAVSRQDLANPLHP